MIDVTTNHLMNCLTNKLIGSNYITNTINLVNKSTEDEVHQVIVSIEKQLIVIMAFQLINPEAALRRVDVFHKGVYQAAIQVATRLMMQLFMIVESKKFN